MESLFDLNYSSRVNEVHCNTLSRDFIKSSTSFESEEEANFYLDSSLRSMFNSLKI